MRIALVSREVYPLASGGIGQFVAGVARVLSEIAEVTILTSSRYRERYTALASEHDPHLPPTAVRVAFVPECEPDELDGWYDSMQCYGARVLERLRELYPDGGPDIVEFPDFLAEGFVTVQAAQGLDPFLEETCVAVRVHTSAEITEVLNGYHHDELSRRALYAMERHALAHADRLIWPLGDVLGAYRRFYGERSLAPPIQIPHPYSGPRIAPAADAGYTPDTLLRLLFVGRLERRKGIINLVRAAGGLDRDDFRLTLLGGDTATGPLGVSVEELLRLTIADDPRFELRAGTDLLGVHDALRAHDVSLVPSVWECAPYVGLEALHANRPVLATPVGGLVEMVKEGETGWLAEDSDIESLAVALERVLEDRPRLERMIRTGGPVARARELCDERVILDRYQQLARVKPRRVRHVQAGAPALVSAVVPYHRSGPYIVDTIESLRTQSYPSLEIVLVNDGSFEQSDSVVAELAAARPLVLVTQTNRGPGAARNFGISQSRGRYVLALDADTVADQSFVERCVELLERLPDIAYATCWSRYIPEDGSPKPGQLGHQPLGNEPDRLVADEGVAATTAALIRRRIFDLGFRYDEELAAGEDWLFYRELARAGHFGVVIPERLLGERMRADSTRAEIDTPRRQRIWGEIDGLMRASDMQWVAPDPAGQNIGGTR